MITRNKGLVLFFAGLIVGAVVISVYAWGWECLYNLCSFIGQGGFCDKPPFIPAGSELYHKPDITQEVLEVASDWCVTVSVVIVVVFTLYWFVSS